MDTSTEVITLSNPKKDSLITRFLAVMGSRVEITSTIWGEDDVDKDYTFLDKSDQTVAWGGDDAIGAVTGAYMDDELGLVAIFNFGDEGDFKVIIKEGQDNLYTLGDL